MLPAEVYLKDTAKLAVALLLPLDITLWVFEGRRTPLIQEEDQALVA